jgi:hypothetical protein
MESEAMLLGNSSIVHGWASVVVFEWSLWITILYTIKTRLTSFVAKVLRLLEHFLNEAMPIPAQFHVVI